MLSFNQLIREISLKKILMHLLSSWMIRRYSKLTRRNMLIITIQEEYFILVLMKFVSMITAIRIMTAALTFQFIITAQMELRVRQNKVKVTWEDLMNSK